MGLRYLTSDVGPLNTPLEKINVILLLLTHARILAVGPPIIVHKRRQFFVIFRAF